MKNIFKYILAAAAVSFAATACVEEETHPYGEPDVDGCYGVYFPAQETNLTLDPEAETAYSLIVSRSKTDGSITVPYSLVSESDVFTVGEISFDDGQKETNLNIDFSKSEVGVEYSVSIKIDDPQYASKYATGATSIDFSILREKWNSLGKAKYTEDFVTTLFGVTNVQYEVEIQENASTKGLFRLVNPYGAAYPYNEAGDWDDTKNYYMVINATNANMVYIKQFNSGMNWGYGNFVFWSLADYYMVNKGKTLKDVYEAGYTGTYADGIITFPKESLMMGMLDYKDGALYLANTNGAFKVVMPGVVEVDYSIEMEAGLTFDGEVPVAFYTGVDADKIRFKAYEGRLNTAEKNNALEAIRAGSEEGTTVIEAVADDPETEDIEYAEAYLSFEKTGVYTLVAATLDAEGKGQEGDVIEFTYVASGDEEENAVVLSCGVGSAEGYREANTDNTVSFYVYGDNIIDAKIAVFSRNDLAADVMGCINKLISSKSVSQEVLEAINGEGYFGLATKLLPGTQYFAVVYASNGYCEDVFVSESSVYTTGDPLPVYQSFTYKDYADELEPESEDVFIGSWNLYAVDMFGDLGMREYIGQAVISDSEIPDEGPDDYGLYDEYLTIEGLSGPYGKKYEFDDALTFDLYGGLLYNASTTTNDEKMEALILTEAGNAYQYAYQQYFIPVMDGYYALVAAKGNYEGGLDVNGIGFYNGGFYAAFCNYLIVDPEKDDNGLAPAPSAKVRKDVCKAIDEALSGIKVPYRPIEKSSDIIMYNNIKSVGKVANSASADFKVVNVEKATKSPKKVSERKIDTTVNRF